MESLASSLKQLMRDEAQPEYSPKGDAGVPPSCSEDTLSAIMGNSSQLVRQDSLRRPINPAIPSFETLPVEILSDILPEMMSLKTLRAIVHAILVDAQAAYQSLQLGSPTVLFSFENYRELGRASSTEPILSLEEATAMASFHLSVIEPLTERYAYWTLNALCSSPEAVPLSKTETGRIQRAIYRLQIICNMEPFDTARLLYILSCFAPWEAEEILCVHGFAKERLTGVFMEIAWDLDQEDNPKYHYLDITSTNSSMLLYKRDYINYDSLADVLCRGPQFLAEIFRATDHEELVDIIEYAIGDYAGSRVRWDDWIDNAGRLVKRLGSETKSEQQAENNLALKRSERYGLALVASSPPDPAANKSYPVDIVAIHGLNGDAYTTWTHPNGTLWIRDLLPRFLPGCRVFTYGYPAQVVYNSSFARLQEH
ncbi:hypothetical protein VMCG_09211 [Cytospora schulzeri]|uniref:Uncharacterized protein n=1 Tax=Cytospora schulzeri TaxID=448051 RepID=A0A423VLI2_9PEZI|nr:hypothetical protein VMCG_09211 [Valsa malicola]